MFFQRKSIFMQNAQIFSKTLQDFSFTLRVAHDNIKIENLIFNHLIQFIKVIFRVQFYFLLFL